MKEHCSQLLGYSIDMITRLKACIHKILQHYQVRTIEGFPVFPNRVNSVNQKLLSDSGKFPKNWVSDFFPQNLSFKFEERSRNISGDGWRRSRACIRRDMTPTHSLMNFPNIFLLRSHTGSLWTFYGHLEHRMISRPRALPRAKSHSHRPASDLRLSISQSIHPILITPNVFYCLSVFGAITVNKRVKKERRRERRTDLLLFLSVIP